MKDGTEELKSWLKERLENCERIAATKTLSDRAGWLEDARFFRAALESLTNGEEWRELYQHEQDRRETLGAFPNAVLEIAVERRRHVEKEGYDAAHDDQHEHGELALAAACYAMDGVGLGNPRGATHWPWGADEFKSRDHRSNLIRAGALIVAEIERLDRAIGA
jgi:hypothetical protein